VGPSPELVAAPASANSLSCDKRWWATLPCDSFGTPLVSFNGSPTQLANQWTQVTIPPIRGPLTPKPMTDRIPPAVDIPLRIHIAGWFPLLDPVAIVVDGSGGSNGEALLNGAEQAEFKATETAKLTGVKQTAPGNAGHLRLIAYCGPFQVGLSSSFSVSAIPRKMGITLDYTLTGPKRGFVVKDTVHSDSGSTADLDQIELSECVEDIKDDFSELTKSHSGYQKGTSTDEHSMDTSGLKHTGSWRFKQTHKFNDPRSNSSDIPMESSGYLVSHDVSKTQIVTSKSGASTEAQGVKSDAGAGGVIQPQLIPPLPEAGCNADGGLPSAQTFAGFK
jgi:hypothetical protein